MTTPTSLAILYVFGGAVYLVMGGDLLVRGAIALSRKAGISSLVVGLTVVAFGTSAPELVVSVGAVFDGFPLVALGNVVGSNIANILLVVGMPALIYPMACSQDGVERDGLFMLFTSVIFMVLCFTGELGRTEGLILLAGLGLFGVYALRASGLKDVWSAESEELPRILGHPSKPAMIGLFLALGIIALPLGAELLIRGAVSLADTVGVSNSVVGLTVVALSTSLPELATTLVAAFKREADVAVGNVIGSNILNIFAIMGITALVSPVPIAVPESFLVQDLPVMLVAAAVLAIVTVRRGTVGRWLGGALLASYIVYAVMLFRPPA